MAKYGVTNVAGGGGIGSDELSVTKDYVLIGKTYVGTDTNDEIGTGTMANNGTTANQSLNAGSSFQVKKGYHAQDFSVNANSLASQTSGTAVTSDILSGKTAWVNGNKITGNIAIQSILSFSCTPYSASQIIFTWQNPSRGPFSGVIIVGKTGGYPTSISDGTRYYKGFGNNAGASGVSNAIVGGFSSGNIYYFRAFSFTTRNGIEWINETTKTANANIQIATQIITSSTNWTVPQNVNSVSVFLVGGGASGGSTANYSGAWGGGGGGYTNSGSFSVSPLEQINIIIGAGGIATYSKATEGSPTSFGKYLSAAGGLTSWGNGGNGGSGGGAGADGGYYSNGDPYGGGGGSNGGNGGNSFLYKGGIGQGTSTRAFGESNGTLYAGGGGGGASFRGGGGSSHGGGSAGAGGGGTGGNWGGIPYSAQKGGNGTPNSGGGGGAGGGEAGDDDRSYNYGGNGGSGICIIRYIK